MFITVTSKFIAIKGVASVTKFSYIARYSYKFKVETF